MPRASAIAAFVVDVRNQQNHILHEALFQRAGNSEGCNGIDYDGKKDTSVGHGMGQSTKKMSMWPYLVGGQVFWQLKLWFLV